MNERWETYKKNREAERAARERELEERSARETTVATEDNQPSPPRVNEKWEQYKKQKEAQKSASNEKAGKEQKSSLSVSSPSPLPHTNIDDLPPISKYYTSFGDVDDSFNLPRRDYYNNYYSESYDAPYSNGQGYISSLMPRGGREEDFDFTAKFYKRKYNSYIESSKTKPYKRGKYR